MEEIERELRRLRRTEEHIDWMGDMLARRCPPGLTGELVHHVIEEETEHREALGRLGPTFGAAAEREARRLDLMCEHLEVIARIAAGDVPPEMAAKLAPHILAEEEEHLRDLAALRRALSTRTGRAQVRPGGERRMVGSWMAPRGLTVGFVRRGPSVGGR